jgi:hypothetical protein
MVANLGMTNVWLGIIAAVSLLEALVILGLGVAAYLVYRRASSLLSTIETEHVAPAMGRVNAILDDVHGVTTKVKEETERVDQAIRTTLDRVDDTAVKVRSNVRMKTSRVVGFMRGVRVAIDELRHNGSRPGPPASEAGPA